jgi:predicted dehydrogenase
MNTPIRAAVVGGHRGGGYGRALAALADRIVLTAICDPKEEVIAAWREAHPRLRGFARYEDLLAADVCDAVLLATPMGLHARQAAEALRAGKHVLSEVIAATTMDECWALVEAAGHGGGDYFVVEDFVDAVDGRTPPAIDV